MDLVSSLRNKKVKVTEIPKWGRYLRKKLENNFANNLSDKEKKSIYLYDDGYLWHIFSYEKGIVYLLHKKPFSIKWIIIAGTRLLYVQRSLC
ncbi:DUF4275 family protein [Metabacillus sp. FJAT-53654]|uniref:DUF4275 family protein n=1 Tax=Metabacillus rhizosphaerae TaxID=3117747 RepID=A0ABZ2N1C8_9BACI